METWDSKKWINDENCKLLGKFYKDSEVNIMLYKWI
jgi:hypothetical protein